MGMVLECLRTIHPNKKTAHFTAKSHIEWRMFVLRECSLIYIYILSIGILAINTTIYIQQKMHIHEARVMASVTLCFQPRHDERIEREGHNSMHSLRYCMTPTQRQHVENCMRPNGALSLLLVLPWKLYLKIKRHTNGRHGGCCCVLLGTQTRN